MCVTVCGTSVQCVCFRKCQTLRPILFLRQVQRRSLCVAAQQRSAEDSLRSFYSRGVLELELICRLHHVSKLAEKTEFVLLLSSALCQEANCIWTPGF